MTTDARTLASDYMDFAKFRSAARFNLATSGVEDCRMEDLELASGDAQLHGPNAGGYAPLIAAVSDRYGVPKACVVMPGGGCSFANHLALATLVSPGDEVVIEDPTYELIASTLRYLQADLRLFPRDPSAAYRLDPARVEAAVTPRTRLIVITNLHNPSSAPAAQADLDAVIALAARVGARVFIDEVYREIAEPVRAPRTSFDAGSSVVTTSSLTKAYGLSGLRCGWIFAPADLAERMRRLNDLFGVHPPHVSEQFAVAAFAGLDRLRARADERVDANRAAYRSLLGGCPALDQHLFPTGTTVFPRVGGEGGDGLHRRLLDDYETSVAPGRFFGRPDHVRIGLGGDVAMTRAGLERLATCLERVPSV